ncbi:unnamed protein product [Pseudo-nitzschia multistriata]|uniref:Transmembrane protein n=1 Tax=Pseudo-nitzschia multistriata TaxID=183589 RepID=A0A448ZM63_9STRA|nr:unnamed protein product [Pseudo-nitzschia multistriata]
MPGNNNDLGSMPEEDAAKATIPLALFLKLGDATTPGTDERNMLFMEAHIGFFAFNFFNVLYILVVQGIIERELQRNKILKITLGACLCQLMSCICSIHRYNTNDEFSADGPFAHISIATGLVAYTFGNSACVLIGLNSNARESIENFAGLGIALHYSVLGVGCCFLTAVYCFLQGYIHWDPDPTKLQNFQPFRKFIGVSTMFQLLAMARCLYKYEYSGVSNERIDFYPNDPARRSRGSVVRMFQTCIFFDLVALGLAGTGIPVVQYPATGSTFSVLTLCSTFVGRMNFTRAPESTEGGDGTLGMLLASDTGYGTPNPRNVDTAEDIEAGADADSSTVSEESRNGFVIFRKQRTP